MSCHMVPIITGAPSLVGYEDDCCISYTVTIVDVRSCTRCTRVPVGQLSSNTLQSMYAVYLCMYMSAWSSYITLAILPYTYKFSWYVIFAVGQFSGFSRFYFQGLPFIQKNSRFLFSRIACLQSLNAAEIACLCIVTLNTSQQQQSKCNVV